MTFPLGDSTNVQTALKPTRQAVWKKPDIMKAVRRLSRGSSSKESSENMPNLTNEEFISRKREFTTFKFYIDNIDITVKKRIERGIKLLGAEQENFFSNKCTHVITSKPIPHYDNLLQSTNTVTAQTKKMNPGPKDNIIDNAIQWNIVLWSVDVMVKTIEFFLGSNSGSRKEVQEKRALGKALQDEKLFGLSTGANNETQTKRPQYTPFTGYYVLIEDAEQAHRPPVIKQFTKKLFTKRVSDCPWPTLKTTSGIRSPFARRSPPPTPPKDKAPRDYYREPNGFDNKENIDPKTNRLEVVIPRVFPPNFNMEDAVLRENVDIVVPNIHTLPITAPTVPMMATPTTTPTTPIVEAPTTLTTPSPTTTPLIAPPSTTPNTTSMIAPSATTSLIAPPTTTPLIAPSITAIGDSQPYSLRASGFQPYTTTHTITTTTQSTSMRLAQPAPPVDNLSHLHKRTIDNVTQQDKQQQPQQKQEEGERRRKDVRYCENCNMVFENMEEHYQEKTHQTFIRDPNNFKQLDLLFEKTRRVYHSPLPEHMRDIIDTNIDGPNVVFAGTKRGHPSPVSQERKKQKMEPHSFAESKEKDWNQYEDVFN